MQFTRILQLEIYRADFHKIRVENFTRNSWAID